MTSYHWYGAVWKVSNKGKKSLKAGKWSKMDEKLSKNAERLAKLGLFDDSDDKGIAADEMGN
jgi:hypothetical protein